MSDHVQSAQRAKDNVETFKRKDGKFEWHLKDHQGRVLATSGSQGYENEQDALDMAWDLFPNLTASQFLSEPEPMEVKSAAQADPGDGAEV